MKQSKKEQIKKLATVNAPISTRKEIAKAALNIILGAIASVVAYFIVEYAVVPVSKNPHSYYYCIKTVSENDTKVNAAPVVDMFSLVIHSKQKLNIKEMSVHGISQFRNYVMHCDDNNVNSGLSQRLAVEFANKSGILKLSNIPTLPDDSKYILNVWGTIDKDYCNPVIVLGDNAFIWPTEASIVAQSYLFFARYWETALFINIMTILTIYYIIRIRYATKN